MYVIAKKTMQTFADEKVKPEKWMPALRRKNHSTISFFAYI
jgi:hypothetical protein